MVMPDIMFPEKITVGDNSIIGYNTTLLAHEYLIREYRLGDRYWKRSDDRSKYDYITGVRIGDGAIVSAGTLVHKDVRAVLSWVGIQCVLFIRKSKWRLEKVHTRNVTFLFFLMNKKEIIEYNILFCFYGIVYTYR